MAYSIPGMPKELVKAAVRLGHAVCVLPEKHRDPMIDGLLSALEAAHADPETTAYERDQLSPIRERLLSALADSPLKLQIDHIEELEAVAKKDRVTRAKRREDLYFKRHKKAHMAEAERKYVPPTKGS